MNWKILFSIALLTISISSIAQDIHLIEHFSIFVDDSLIKDVVEDSVFIMSINNQIAVSLEFKDGKIRIPVDVLLKLESLKSILILRFKIYSPDNKLKEYQSFFITDILFDLTREDISLKFYDLNTNGNYELRKSYQKELKSLGFKRKYIKKVSYMYRVVYKKNNPFGYYRRLLVSPHIPPYIDYEKRRKLGLKYGVSAVKIQEVIN